MLFDAQWTEATRSEVTSLASQVATSIPVPVLQSCPGTARYNITGK